MCRKCYLQGNAYRRSADRFRQSDIVPTSTYLGGTTLHLKLPFYLLLTT